jgi:hypothetical protein
MDSDENKTTRIQHSAKTQIYFSGNKQLNPPPDYMVYDTVTKILTINGNVYTDSTVNTVNYPTISGKIEAGTSSLTSFIDKFNSIQTRNNKSFTI